MDAFLVDALVFKTGERRKSLVGSIPMHSRHSMPPKAAQTHADLLAVGFVGLNHGGGFSGLALCVHCVTCRNAR